MNKKLLAIQSVVTRNNFAGKEKKKNLSAINRKMQITAEKRKERTPCFMATKCGEKRKKERFRGKISSSFLLMCGRERKKERKKEREEKKNRQRREKSFFPCVCVRKKEKERQKRKSFFSFFALIFLEKWN